jgi:hypothetical protein
VQYFDASGRRRREKIGRKSAAIKLYGKRKDEALQGRKLPETLRSIVRVFDLAPALLRDYSVNKNKSYDSVDRQLRKHVLLFFGALSVNDVDTETIDRYVNCRKAECAENATINREMAALKRMYNLARRSAPPKISGSQLSPPEGERAPAGLG